MSRAIGEQFQQETKYHRHRMEGGVLDWAARPRTYKDYPGSRKLDLPKPASREGASLDEVLRSRRSIRDFTSEPVSKEQLSYLLWASTGIQRTEAGYKFRTAPSAGALYPVETYLVINNVAGIAKGVYHYSVKDHQLEELKAGDSRREIAQAGLGQSMCAGAAAVFIWTGVFRRTTWKYQQRGYRYVYLDAGHIAENLALAATSLGLGSCEVGALFDEEVNSIVDVDGVEESVLCMCAIGPF